MAKKVHIDFLYDIKDGKINNFNKEREYEKRLKNTEIKLVNRKKLSKFTGRYEHYINVLKIMLVLYLSFCLKCILIIVQKK